MGMRIHKSIGYGYTCPTPLDLSEVEEMIWDYKLRDFAVWTRDHVEVINEGQVLSSMDRTDLVLMEALIRDLPEGATLSQHLVRNDEFGVEGFIQLIPPGYGGSFLRYDDIIDYCEEYDAEGGPRVCVRDLPCGLYPFDKGRVPFSVRALAHFCGIAYLIPHLKETVYIFWA